MAWTGFVLAWVARVGVCCLMKKFFPLDADQPVKVSFIYVNHTQTMNFGVAWFFLNHHVYNRLPSLVSEPVADGIINKGHVYRDELLASLFEYFAFLGVEIKTVGIDKGLVMT